MSKDNWRYNIVRYHQIPVKIVVLVYILPAMSESDCFPIAWPTEYVLIIFYNTNHIDEHLYLSVLLILISLMLSEKHIIEHIIICYGPFYIFLMNCLCLSSSPLSTKFFIFFAPQFLKGLFRHLFKDVSFVILYIVYCSCDKLSLILFGFI